MAAGPVLPTGSPPLCPGGLVGGAGVSFGAGEPQQSSDQAGPARIAARGSSRGGQTSHPVHLLPGGLGGRAGSCQLVPTLHLGSGEVPRSLQCRPCSQRPNSSAPPLPHRPLSPALVPFSRLVTAHSEPSEDPGSHLHRRVQLLSAPQPVCPALQRPACASHPHPACGDTASPRAAALSSISASHSRAREGIRLTGRPGLLVSAPLGHLQSSPPWGRSQMAKGQGSGDGPL